MDEFLVQLTQCDVQYNGRFANPALGPFANGYVVLQMLLNHMQKYGATLRDLKYEAPTLSDASMSCSLPELNATIRLRPDRFETTFTKLHEVGTEIAQNIFLDGWAAVQEIEPSIEIVEHRIVLNGSTQIHGASYDALIRRYVSIPPPLSENARAGVLFYLPEDPAQGEREGSLVLHQSAGQEQALLLLVNVTLDARRVPFNDLVQRVNAYVTRYLGYLGLALDHEGRR